MNSADRTTEVTSKPERRYELDWLRVFAVLLLIYFHTAAIFYRGNLGEFYVKNDVASPAMQLFITFVHQWHMPLFFLVSGSSTWFALSFRTGSEYIKERFKRIFIPFLFGTLVIVPPQVYYRLLSNPDYQASYLEFYPQFFNGIRPKGNFEWAHLWFLIYLLVFSLIALPLFLHFKKKENQSLIPIIANFLEKPGAIFLLAIPLAIIEGALRPRWPGLQNLYDDWANFCLYLLYFIYGYLLCSDSRFKQAIDKNLKVSVILAVAGMTVLLYLWGTDTVPKQGYSLEYVGYQIFRGFNSWCWVIALLGLAQRYLNFNNRLLQYASAACYPFYILHQTVLVAIGFYVVQWNAGIMEKFWIISTASLIGTIILYDIFVKRINILRFLFGLKPINPEPVISQEKASPTQ